MEQSSTGETSIETMRLDSGHLSLDFANTSNWHASDSPIEFLTDFGALATFGRRTGTLTEAEARQLTAEAGRKPREARAVLDRAIELREAIYRIFVALEQGEAVEAADLGVLNDELANALAQAQIAANPDGFAWTWGGPASALDRMLWPVARAAADLLASDDRQQVGQCADDRGCGWLFLDTSRNQSRRWCDMNGCGNRAKARRHYRKQRAGTTADR